MPVLCRFSVIQRTVFSYNSMFNWITAFYIIHSCPESNLKIFPCELTVIRYDKIRLDELHKTVSLSWQSPDLMQQMNIEILGLHFGNNMWNLTQLNHAGFIFREQKYQSGFRANEFSSWDMRRFFLFCHVSLSQSWSKMGVSAFTACQYKHEALLAL